MNVLHCQGFFSHALHKRFTVDFFIPDRLDACTNFLMMNDGQMSGDLQLSDTLSRFEQEGLNIFTASIHASAERIQEYGVRSWPDYRQRGARAWEYEKFITTELFPFIRSSFKFNYHPERSVYAGYSLGALSAFDIVWENPNLFSKLGAFSGSFWWRSQAFNSDNPDGHRIMHQKIEQSTKKEGVKFWFQAGTEDEKSDRNNNGVIDVIDDINDLMHRLQLLGYDPNQDMYYHEMHGGRHEPQTWAEALPVFLNWAFKDKH